MYQGAILSRFAIVSVENRRWGMKEEPIQASAPEPLSSPVMQLPAPASESEAENGPDETLVLLSYQFLRRTFERPLHRAMLTAGNFIIRHFFDNDFERAKNPRNATRIHSLNELIRRLQGNDGNGPSKTWVYNAVKLAVDEYQFRRFSVYGKLGLSHKVYLTHVKNLEDKRQLIREVFENNYTVAQLRARISDLRRNGHPEKVRLEALPDDYDFERAERDDLLRFKEEAALKIEFHKDRLAFYKERLGLITRALNSIAAKRNALRDGSKVIGLGPREALGTDLHGQAREQGVV